MATRGALGGLNGVISEAIDVVGASGKDFILVETVGVGQSELDVFDYVDTVMVVLAPDSGDSIQAMKAGLLEIADIFVVNKSDLSGAERVRNNLRVMLESGKKRDGWEIPVVMCQAEQDEGIDELWDRVLSHRQFLVESGLFEQKRARQRSGNFQRLLERIILSEIKAVMQGSGLRELEGKVQRGEIDPYTAADDAIKSIMLRVRGKKKR